MYRISFLLAHCAFISKGDCNAPCCLAKKLIVSTQSKVWTSICLSAVCTELQQNYFRLAKQRAINSADLPASQRTIFSSVINLDRLAAAVHLGFLFELNYFNRYRSFDITCLGFDHNCFTLNWTTYMYRVAEFACLYGVS